MTVTGRTPGGKSPREQEEAVVDGDQSFGIAVAFARTPEGQRVADALRKALSEGAPVELAGTRLAHDSGQDVHPRGPGREIQPETIQVTPLIGARSWPVRIEVESAEGRAAYPRVDLRYASSRDDRLVMTNEHQALPYLVTLEIADDGAALRLSPRRREHGVYEARNAAAFALAIQSRGAVVRVVRLDSGSPLLELTTRRAPPTRRLRGCGAGTRSPTSCASSRSGSPATGGSRSTTRRHPRRSRPQAGSSACCARGAPSGSSI